MSGIGWKSLSWAMFRALCGTSPSILVFFIQDFTTHIKFSQISERRYVTQNYSSISSRILWLQNYKSFNDSVFVNTLFFLWSYYIVWFKWIIKIYSLIPQVFITTPPTMVVWQKFHLNFLNLLISFAISSLLLL